MNRYALTHVPDPALLRELKTLVAQDRATTALLLAHLAEVDARRLYAPAGQPLMFAWCVAELRFSADAACNRIRAARTARQYPVVFTMLADGRLHLSAVVMLTPYLTPAHAADLLAAAAHRSRAEIEQLLAERFPRPDLPERIEGPALSPGDALSVPGRMNGTAVGELMTAGPAGTATTVALSVPGRMKFADTQLSPGTVGMAGTGLALALLGPPPRRCVAPLAPAPPPLPRRPASLPLRRLKTPASAPPQRQESCPGCARSGSAPTRRAGRRRLGRGPLAATCSPADRGPRRRRPRS